MIYSLYDADGKIYAHYHGEIPDDQGERYVEGRFNMDDYYIDDATIQLRPELSLTISTTMVVANGVDTITLSGSISGRTLLIRGPQTQLVELDADEYEFSTTIPGIYTLIIEAFPYKKTEFSIVAMVPE